MCGAFVRFMTGSFTKVLARYLLDQPDIGRFKFCMLNCHIGVNRAFPLKLWGLVAVLSTYADSRVSFVRTLWELRDRAHLLDGACESCRF